MIGRLTTPYPATLGSVVLAPPVGTGLPNAVISASLPQPLPAGLGGFSRSPVAAQPLGLQTRIGNLPPHTSAPRPFGVASSPSSVSAPSAIVAPVRPYPVAPPPVAARPPNAEPTKQKASEDLARRVAHDRALLKAAGFADNVTLPPANEDPRGDYLENMKYVEAREPWLTLAACEDRRRRYGLDAEQSEDFCNECEFISLGCQCVPSRTLQALNLRNASYPFDWARTGVQGVIHLFNTRFKDLLETCGERYVDENTGSYVISMKWGGSCVHHDPEVPKTRVDFTRRAERLLGSGSVLPSQTRVFVRAANSSEELYHSLALFRAVQNALPQARCYLLVVLDLQPLKGPVQPAFNDIIHYCISKDVYDDGHYSMQRHVEAYAEAIAFAVRAWSGDLDAMRAIREAPQMAAVCQRFTGGDPSKEFFKPIRY